jgi:hypothetical protein
MSKRGSIAAACLIVCLISTPQPVGAWGSVGHLWVNQVAASKLAAPMPEFMLTAAARERLRYLGPEPDRWRSSIEKFLKNAQEPDHFFNSEAIPSDFGDLPAGRYDYIHRLYERRAIGLLTGMDRKQADELLPERIGFQPYIVMEVFDRLRNAFREYRHFKAAGEDATQAEQNAIFYAGWLGHYVADGAQPLHDSVNYDGWVGPNPNGYVTAHGIHADFETRFVNENLKPEQFASLVTAPVQLKDPFKDYQQYMRDSLAQMEPLYKLEKAGGFKGAGTPEAREFTLKRLAAGSQMLANLWYTAWMESAVDPPPYRPKTATPAPAATTNQTPK